MNHYMFLLFCLIMCSCNQKPESLGDRIFHIDVVDAQGNRVLLDSVPQRVVCVFDPAIDIIYMLQEQKKLVGVNTDTYFDKELFDYYKHIDSRIANRSLAAPGGNDMLNIESTLALNPDLVIAQNLTPNVVTMLNDMGIAVYLASSESYTDVVKEMKDISLLLGKDKRGDSLVQYAIHKIEDLKSRSKNYIDNGGELKKVYFTWANGRVFSTAGRNSMMNDCLVLAGVENACPSDVDNPNINPETLISWNPDMIVMWNDSPSLFYDKKELGTIKAIKEKQIFNLMPMFYYNPHTLKALCAAVVINNWAYPKDQSSAEEELKEIIVKLYGKETGQKLLNFYL